MTGRVVRIRQPCTQRRRAFCGGLDTVRGRWVCADDERKLAVHFVAFLQQVAATYPSGPLDLALDNAPTHTAKVVERWLAAHPPLHVLWLPPSAPHAPNPLHPLPPPLQHTVAPPPLPCTL